MWVLGGVCQTQVRAGHSPHLGPVLGEPLSQCPWRDPVNQRFTAIPAGADAQPEHVHRQAACPTTAVSLWLARMQGVQGGLGRGGRGPGAVWGPGPWRGGKAGLGGPWWWVLGVRSQSRATSPLRCRNKKAHDSWNMGAILVGNRSSFARCGPKERLSREMILRAEEGACDWIHGVLRDNLASPDVADAKGYTVLAAAAVRSPACRGACVGFRVPLWPTCWLGTPPPLHAEL